MSKLPAALVAIAIAITPALAVASALRISLTKANQPTAPLKYTITTAVSSGMVIVSLELPRKQTPLDHLWRIDIVMRKGAKNVLSAPLETKLDNGALEAEIILDPAAMKDAEIWIRTGEHAPLAETIYAIELGSFK
jgi:hypothetical protein